MPKKDLRWKKLDWERKEFLISPFLSSKCLTMAQLHINEFLCFLSVQFDKFTRENLITTLVEANVFNKALEAKNYLITKCTEHNIDDPITEYTKSRMRGRSGALLRVVADAVDIWTACNSSLPIQTEFPVQTLKSLTSSTRVGWR